MDQILDIKLTFVGDEVVVQDDTNTSHLGADFNADNYVSVDFFINDKDIVVSKALGNPKEDVRIKLNDGKHKHRKLWIPKKEYLEKSENDSKVNEIYYHEGKIFKVINGGTEEVNISTASKLIDGGNAATQTWYSTFKTIFCTSKLRKCVSLLQKQVIESCHKCNNIDSIKVKRDFLFNAMYLIDYLKETGNLDEAQRILDNLSCCGFICDDSIINTSNNCCD